MSREDDARELRKLEYLERRGVATFTDSRRRKILARKIALEDFEAIEGVEDPIRRLERRAVEKSQGKPPEKKGTSN